MGSQEAIEEQIEEERRRANRRAMLADNKDPRAKKGIRLRGMDPIVDYGQKRRHQGSDSDDPDHFEGHSSEEEENQTFMQKLGGFLFFGCGGSSKR